MLFRSTGKKEGSTATGKSERADAAPTGVSPVKKSARTMPAAAVAAIAASSTDVDVAAAPVPVPAPVRKSKRVQRKKKKEEADWEV